MFYSSQIFRLFPVHDRSRPSTSPPAVCHHNRVDSGQ
jgi:hypothetical protein